MMDILEVGTYLEIAFDDWGIENFEKKIICLCKDQDEMNEMESYLIEENVKREIKLYNLDGVYDTRSFGKSWSVPDTFIQDMVSSDRFVVEKENHSFYYPTTLLLDVYNEWANRSRKPNQTQTAFTNALQKAGYETNRLYYLIPGESKRTQKICVYGVAPVVDGVETFESKKNQDLSGGDLSYEDLLQKLMAGD